MNRAERRRRKYRPNAEEFGAVIVTRPGRKQPRRVRLADGGPYPAPPPTWCPPADDQGPEAA